MKNLFIIFVFLIYVSTLIAQPTKPKFIEANPLWTYQLNYDNLKDTSGNEVAGNLNVFGPATLLKDSFMISVSRTFTAELNIDGFIIIKNNNYTGQVIWKDIYNYHNGSDGFFATLSDSGFDKNGNIEIFGRRRVVAKDAEVPMSFRRVYDFDTGEVLNFEYDPENKIQIPNRNGTVFVPVAQDSMYLNFYMAQFGYPDTTRFRMVAALFNNKLDSLIDPTIFDVEYIPEFSINDFSLHAFSFRRVNDSITVAYVTFREGKSSLYKTSSQLIFINHKDIHDIHIMKVKDLESTVKFNLLYPRNIQFEVRNGEIYLMDFDVVFPGPTAKPWIWRMDALGNDIEFLYDMQVDTSDYNNAYVLSTNDSMMHILCYPSMRSVQGYDIITKDNNQNYQYLASITLNSTEPKQNYFSTLGSHFLTNDSILIYSGSYQDRKDVIKSGQWLMTFNLNDLIRGSLVSTDNTYNDIRANLEIYPNPGTGYFTLNTPESMWNQKGTLEIYDIQGSKIRSIEYGNIIKSMTFDISDLKSGMYFVIIKNRNSQSQPAKIIKLD